MADTHPTPLALSRIGLRFGRLTIIDCPEKRQGRSQMFRVRCDCGNEKLVQFGGLTSGDFKSCGCYKIDVTRKRQTTHGLSKTREYKTWWSMIERCESKDHPSYPDYGGRGISVCERWRIFENFFADMGVKPPRLSIDRINNDGNYEPGNCRWATYREQNQNKRGNNLITFNGETLCAAEWARRTGIKLVTIRARLRDGWRVDAALTKEPISRHLPRRVRRSFVVAASAPVAD